MESSRKKRIVEAVATAILGAVLTSVGFVVYNPFALVFGFGVLIMGICTATVEI